MKILDIVILALATWRLSSLFVIERGPGIFKRKSGKREKVGLFEAIRELYGIYDSPDHTKRTDNPKGEIGKLLNCTLCFSVWAGGFLTLAYFLFGKISQDGNIVVWLCLPLALSSLAIFMEEKLAK